MQFTAILLFDLALEETPLAIHVATVATVSRSSFLAPGNLMLGANGACSTST